MVTNKFTLFGKKLNIEIRKYIDSNHKYDLSKDQDKIIIYSKNISNIDENIKYVYQDLFYKIIIPEITKKSKEVVKLSGFNSIEFDRNSRVPLKIKYYDKQKNISNVMTYEKCSKCGANMKLITSPKTGKRFLGCSNYPKCSNSLFFNKDSNKKSKNGWYIYGSPFLMSMKKEVIDSKIIYCLIQTYKKYDSYDFYVELAKLCPNYFVINNLAADDKLKKQIKSILDSVNDKNSENIIQTLFPVTKEKNNV